MKISRYHFLACPCDVGVCIPKNATGRCSVLGCRETQQLSYQPACGTSDFALFASFRMIHSFYPHAAVSTATAARRDVLYIPRQKHWVPQAHPPSHQ